MITLRRFRTFLARYAVLIVIGAITIGVIMLAGCT